MHRLTRVSLAVLNCVTLCIFVASAVAQEPPTATTPATAPSRDHLVGWYALPPRSGQTQKIVPGPDTLIPVLKAGDGYYTVSRGMEIPLKPCSDGLEWGIERSSMVGTRIGLDKTTGGVYLAVYDAQLANNDDFYTPGVIQPMQSVVAPKGIADPTAAEPKTLDGFIGWYEPLWLPGMRYEIRRENGKYILGAQLFKEGRWQSDDHLVGAQPHEITPVADGLGFNLDAKGKARFVYNLALKRFEIQLAGAPVRTPMVRMDPSAASSPPTPIAARAVGIATWH